MAETVPGGIFNRSNNSSYPALVNDFRLDHFEVTVGRFRRFVEAYANAKPAPGAGESASIPGSGWSGSWDGFLPANQIAMENALKCDPTYATWTDMAGANEDKPINCVSWYEAFAFCAWDGGRLPTEAEWNYAAAGGTEQRDFPWGIEIDPSHAVYDCTGDGIAGCAFTDILSVGSKSTTGDAFWLEADLGGSVREWVLDFNAAYSPLCDNCANLTPGFERVARGGGFNNAASFIQTSARQHSDPSAHSYWLGLRCASEL